MSRRYVSVYVNGRQVQQHVLVAERAIGKRLPPGAVVHHVNRDPTDNRPENLVICDSQAFHWLLHRRERALDACGHVDWLRCPYCKKYDDPSVLYLTRNGRAGYHRACENTANNARRAKRKANAK